MPIIAHKNIGETPLQLLERLRVEKSELSQKTLSYAGRLDPMAEGEMLILVGDEDNARREKFLDLEKEYEATFLIGPKTDTGDILGIINDYKKVNLTIFNKKIQYDLKKIIKLKKQTYPWFSGKTVGGKKLFEYFKEGNTGIERPTKDIKIKKAKLLKKSQISKVELERYILESISLVKGDFRQKEILKKWFDFFDDNKNSQFIIFSVSFHVSSGTFIRALTDEFSFNTVLLRLNRTKICVL